MRPIKIKKSKTNRKLTTMTTKFRKRNEFYPIRYEYDYDPYQKF